MSTQLDCFVIFETEIYLSSSYQLQGCTRTKPGWRRQGETSCWWGRPPPSIGGAEARWDRWRGRTPTQRGGGGPENGICDCAAFGYLRLDMACISHPMEVSHDTLPSEDLILCVSVWVCRGGVCTSPKWPLVTDQVTKWPSDLMVMRGESEACRDEMDQRSQSQGTHLGVQFLFEMIMFHMLTLGALDVAKTHCRSANWHKVSWLGKHTVHTRLQGRRAGRQRLMVRQPRRRMWMGRHACKHKGEHQEGLQAQNNYTKGLQT